MSPWRVTPGAGDSALIAAGPSGSELAAWAVARARAAEWRGIVGMQSRSVDLGAWSARLLPSVRL